MVPEKGAEGPRPKQRWKVHFSSKRQRIFFCNVETKERSWYRPSDEDAEIISAD